MDDPHNFEKEVRRIARYRWPYAEYGGSEMLVGKERDGVFFVEDAIHLLECTTSREKAKAKKDLEKLYELSKTYRKSHADRAVKCWLVTQQDPTADQRACRKEIKGAADNLFNILSFAQFQAGLIDAYDYLQFREQHKFGSIYDPATQSPITNIKYIEVGLHCNGDDECFSTEQMADSLLAGKRFSVLGEYGVGKSMCLRQIYKHLVKRYRQSRTHKIPFYLNLREHQGQQEPAEILERHARYIGFRSPSQLVRAWKAGFVVLLLDGFDEVSSLGLQGAWRRLKDARFASMYGVRNLVSSSPIDCGIVIAGREHFFDSEDERKKALGQTTAWRDIRLDEFTESQIVELVKQFGFSGEIPSWVPSRPLLLSTLFARGLSVDATNQLSVVDDPASGWDFLLDEVCNREARIEFGISGENVRTILEALATLARCKESGIGPLAPTDIIGIFQSECGFSPTDEALIVLQRLPGLGRDPSSPDDSRAFVDVEFADACRAGDFVRFCMEPFNHQHSKRLSETCCVIGQTGIGLSARILKEGQFREGHLTAALKAVGNWNVSDRGATPADLIQLALKLDLTIKDAVEIRKLNVQSLDIDAARPDICNVSFVDCFFDSVFIDSDVTATCCPKFKECLIQNLDGKVSEDDLPVGRFFNCVIESYASSTRTTNSTLELDVPIGVRVLVTVLKKLFVQGLSGRKENALYRGLDAYHQSKVSSVLTLLKGNAVIVPSGRGGEPIWVPVRRQRPRVLKMIGSLSKSTDPIMLAAREI